MNTLYKNGLIALSALALAGSAVAQSPAPAPAPMAGHAGQHGQHGQHAGKHARLTPEQRQARMAERQAELRAALKLTPAQEPAWNAFVASRQPAGPMKQADRAARHAEMAAMPLPQRMEKRLERMKARQARMEQRVAAFKTFYAALTPAQQKVLEERMQRRGGRHGDHGGEHGRRGMHRAG